jgi:hypothetical protein
MWLDAARQYELRCDERDAPASVRCGGADLPLRGSGLAVVEVDTPLRQLILLSRDTGHPVLLTEGGSFRGVCGPREIIRALARGDGAPGQADAAN